MDQLPLFPDQEIKLTYCQKPDHAQIRTLDKIAMQASKEPLLMGDIGHSTYPNRLSKISRCASNTTLDLYLINKGNELIGAAYIWDGYLASEMEHGKPETKLAFVKSEYRNKEPLIRKVISQQLQAIKENQQYN
tara:strand:- start:12648 stop:13049 length:402 start_codon:yes stop_codon:yes gene_type:complete